MKMKELKWKGTVPHPVYILGERVSVGVCVHVCMHLHMHRHLSRKMDTAAEEIIT